MKRKSENPTSHVSSNKDSRTSSTCSPCPARAEDGGGAAVSPSHCAGSFPSSSPSSSASSSPFIYKVAGEGYDVHVTNQLDMDKETEAWFAKVNNSISKVSKHFDTRLKAVVGLDCEWCPVCNVFCSC